MLPLPRNDLLTYIAGNGKFSEIFYHDALIGRKQEPKGSLLTEWPGGGPLGYLVTRWIWQVNAQRDSFLK